MYNKMKTLPKWMIILVLSTSMIPHTVNISQASDEGGSDETRPEISDGATNASVKLLNQGRNECSNIRIEYKIDCLRQVYSRAAGPLKAPEYSGARKELRSTSRTLKKLVQKNLDKSKPVLKVGRRSYKAVKKTVVASLNREASKVISESATRLLRSASKSKQRRSHYTKIAKAFDSTKVILRS